MLLFYHFYLFLIVCIAQMLSRLLNRGQTSIYDEDFYVGNSEVENSVFTTDFVGRFLWLVLIKMGHEVCAIRVLWRRLRKVLCNFCNRVPYITMKLGNSAKAVRKYGCQKRRNEKKCRLHRT
jgi:hypothetical protein